MSNYKKDYSGTIQNLLYCYPLYNHINKNKVRDVVCERGPFYIYKKKLQT